jgi:hypothetical protein
MITHCYLLSVVQPIATRALFCSLVPILFQKMLMFMKPDMTAASNDGKSNADDPTFIVNVVKTIHDKADDKTCKNCEPRIK